MDALVLSGGSIKGSYQAGAVAEALAWGLAPGILTGTSVGALNVAYLAACAESPADVAWPEIGNGLAHFWQTAITGPGIVGKKRGVLDLLWRIWRKRWAGLVSTAPLERLVRETLGPYFPRTGGVTTRVAAVNLRTGMLDYVGPESPHFLDAVLASTAEPMLMPTRTVNGDEYVDGGIREISPLAEAIRLGATRIVCVVCQPERVRTVKGNWGDPCQIIGRLTTIASNEIVNNDIARCRKVNADVAAGRAPGKRLIDLTVIRPAKELPIALDSFGPADIVRMVEYGRRDARAALAVAKAA